VDGIPTKVSQS